MRIGANDPRWTAYALGEITDEQEKAELESILKESGGMRSVVEEIRRTADLLTEELRSEPQLQLSQSQKEKIESKANAGRSWLRLIPAWALAGVATVVAVAFSITLMQSRRHETASGPKNPGPILTAEVRESNVPRADSAMKPLPALENASAPKTEHKDATGPANAVSVMKKAKGEAGQATVGRGGLLNVPAASADEAAVLANPPGSTQAPFHAIESAPVSPASMRTMFVASQAAGAGNILPQDAAHGRPRADLLPIQRQSVPFNTEAYDYIGENPFLNAGQNPLSTFSIDVDTASYSNVRRFIESGAFPPKDAVRIEELVNYFDYEYKGPKDEKPFAASFELTEAPWKPEHKLLRIGLKGREIKSGNRPAGNLVFLLDVSGSMADENKLPLVKESMRLLVDQLNESDQVAIVVYASNTSLLLPSTSGDQKQKLLQAIDGLHAGGSTNGAAGIQLAYQTAQQNFIQGGINRVILATDGDFNVGITNRGDLTRLIEEKAKSGIFLSALGFGMGNYKDATLELLATKGRGNYAYIDTLNEAKKVLVEQVNSTLVTIAKDVKIQVEFNPRRVGQYRLIGYEDRTMPKEDFNDDAKSAGAIGAGHTVTALYEIVPAEASNSAPKVDPLKYQKPVQPSSSADSDELLTLKIRSKEPEKDKSVVEEFTVRDSAKKFREASQDFKFAAAVAAFGMVLRDSQYKGSATLDQALEWANEGTGADTHGYRQEFIRLIHRALSLNP
jgi:Ca-activated chloride channel family protein